MNPIKTFNRWRNTVNLKRTIEQARNKRFQTGKDYHIMIYKNRFFIVDNSYILTHGNQQVKFTHLERAKRCIWSTKGGLKKNVSWINERKLNTY